MSEREFDTSEVKGELWRLWRFLGGDPLMLPSNLILRWPWVFYRQLQHDKAFLRAAGMAYATLITIVPALVLVYALIHGLGLLGPISGGPEAVPPTLPSALSASPDAGVDSPISAMDIQEQEAIRLLFATVLGEHTPKAVEFILEGLAQVDVRTLSLTGILALLIVAGRLYLQVEEAYCDIFRVPHNRSWVLRLLNFYFSITAIPLVLAFTAVSALEFSEELGLAWVRTPFIAFLQFLLLLAALKLLPSTRVHWVPALTGAFVSSALLQGGGQLFGLYLLWFSSDDPVQIIYGSLGIIPVFLFWLYIQWVIVLLGVEVAHVIQNFDSLMAMELELHEFAKKKVRILGVDAMLQVIGRIAVHFARGGGAMLLTEIEQATGLNQRDLSSILVILEEEGLLLRAEGGWALRRPAETIELSGLVAAWRHRTHVTTRDPSLQQRVSQAMRVEFQGTVAEMIVPWLPPLDDGDSRPDAAPAPEPTVAPPPKNPEAP